MQYEHAAFEMSRVTFKRKYDVDMFNFLFKLNETIPMLTKIIWLGLNILKSWNSFISYKS